MCIFPDLIPEKSFVYLLHDSRNEERMQQLFDTFTSGDGNDIEGASGKRKVTPGEPLMSPSGLCLRAHRTPITAGHAQVGRCVGPEEQGGIDLGKKGNIQLVAVLRDGMMDVHPGPTEVIKAGDELFYACVLCQGLFSRELHARALTHGKALCHCFLLDTEETTMDESALPMDCCLWPEALDRATFGPNLVAGARTAINMRQTNGCRLVGVSNYYPVAQ